MQQGLGACSPFGLVHYSAVLVGCVLVVRGCWLVAVRELVCSIGGGLSLTDGSPYVLGRLAMGNV